MNSELYEEEVGKLQAQLAAQSRTLAEKAQQVESLRAELSEMATASIEKVRGLEAELEEMRERLAASEAKAERCREGQAKAVAAAKEEMAAEIINSLSELAEVLNIDKYSHFDYFTLKAKELADFRARVEAEFGRLRADYRQKIEDYGCCDVSEGFAEAIEMLDARHQEVADDRTN